MEPTDKLTRLHDQLVLHLKELRDCRSTGRAYLIEHPLDGDELKELELLVSACLQRWPWTQQEFWRYRYLPVLLVAVEVGYQFEGAGKAYWRHLEQRLGFSFDKDGAHRLSRYFEHMEHRTGVCRPDTPWARHKHHIAWPITHAVFPRAIHAPLFQAVCDLDLPVQRDTSPETLAGSISDWAARHGQRRLSVLASHPQEVSDIIKAFLVPGHQPQSLSPWTVERMRVDLEQGQLSRPLVIQARSRLDSPPAAPSCETSQLTRSGRSTTAPLTLRKEGDELVLQLALPRTRLSRDQLRVESQQRRTRVRLFGTERPQRLRSLLSGLPVRLSWDVPLLAPDGSATEPLFPGLTEQDAGSRQAFLSLQALQADLRSPVLLSSEMGGPGEWRQVRTRSARLGGSYRLVLHERLLKAAPPRSVRLQRTRGSLVWCEVDTSDPAARDWLEVHNIETSRRPRLRAVGAPPLAALEHSEPEWLAGDLVVFEVEDGPVTVTDVEQLVDSGLWRLELTEQPGMVQLQWSDGWGATARDWNARVAHPRPHRSAVFARLHSEAEATVDALRLGRVALRVESPLCQPIQGLECELVARSGALVIARSATGPLGPLPVDISSEHPALEWLREQLQESEQLDDGSPLTLELHLGGLRIERWALEPADRPAWWEDQSPQEEEEVAADTPRRHYSCASPLIATELVPRLLPPGSLVVPIVEGREVWTLGEVVGGPRLVLSSVEPPILTQRLRRALNTDDGAEGIGVAALADALQRWSQAGARHLGGLAVQRLVEQALDRWLAEALCGREWAAREPERPLPLKRELIREQVRKLLVVPDLAVDGQMEDTLADKGLDQRIELLRRSTTDLLTWRWSVLESLMELEDDEANRQLSELAQELIDSGQLILDQSGISEDSLDVKLPLEETLEAVAAVCRAVRASEELSPLLPLIQPDEALRGIRDWTYDNGDEKALTNELVRLLGLRGGRPVRWSVETVQALLDFWLRPSTSGEVAGRDLALAHALRDRLGARLVRYAVVRSWRARAKEGT